MLQRILNENNDVDKILKPALSRMNGYHVKIQTLVELLEDDARLIEMLKQLGLHNDIAKVIGMLKSADLKTTDIVSNLEHEIDFQRKSKK